MAVTARWPLHPCPLPYESLSSWISRLAKEYNLSTGELLSNALSIKFIRNHLIDYDPPDELIMKLSTYTGVNEASIRAMTLQGYVPWIIDTLDINNSECLRNYATQYRTLLPPKIKWMSSGVRKRYKKKITYCRPWIAEPYGKEYLFCAQCIRTDSIPYDRIFWRLCMMASCHIHGCLLDISDCSVVKLIPSSVSKPADDNLLSVDKLTFQALTVGEVTLPNGSMMNACVYVRFLRSLIEEIFCRPSSMRRCKHHILLEMIELLGIDILSWGSSGNSLLFERLPFSLRCYILKMIGFLLSDLPLSLSRWQTMQYTTEEKRILLPNAIAEIL